MNHAFDKKDAQLVLMDHKARVTLSKTLLICGILAVTLLLVGIIAASLGSEHMPLVDVLRAVFTGGYDVGGLNPTQRAILFDIRLPRILLAATVGASLAAAGASYQALLRNALAEPYLLGISNGAAVGTMLAMVFLGANEWTRPLMAFAGALGATFVVYLLAGGRVGASPEKLILAGVIVTTFQSSLIVFITTLMDATRIRSFTFWLLGDLSQAAPSSLWIAVPSVIIGVVALAFNARPLNLLMLGQRDAFDLGVEVQTVRLQVFLAASLLVGVSVSLGGSVGYVGLVVPHLIRMSTGVDNRLTIPAAALAGAAFVVLADTLARTVIAPRELPVGAITALIGAPIFVYLLKRR
ncbi:MAG TPA: iron ABC transporter permease [Pyrinomonadaceae bacterium]|nr:iron ABC transporter permease [Pyrinomonadaceae bacterium]